MEPKFQQTGQVYRGPRTTEPERYVAQGELKSLVTFCSNDMIKKEIQQTEVCLQKCCVLRRRGKEPGSTVQLLSLVLFEIPNNSFELFTRLAERLGEAQTLLRIQGGLIRYELAASKS